MITNYESFLGNGGIYKLSEGICPSVNLSDFKSLFEPKLFESSGDKLLLEKMYAKYELGILYENRKSWFENDVPIYMLEGNEHKILFKESSMFILSNASFAILNEEMGDGGWDWISDQTTSVIKRVNDNTEAAINAIATASKETWDALSDGAKKVYEFGKKITLSVVEFVKANPLEVAAIVLQILSILASFFPPVGVWLSPILLAISGALEIYDGITNIKKSYEKLKLVEPNNIKRSVEAFSAGGPLLIAGLISMIFGTHDIITSPLAGTGVVPIASMGGKVAAETWGKTFAGALVHNFEHFSVHTLNKAATKIGPKLSEGFTKFIVAKGAEHAPTLISMLFIVVGKHILGGLWNGVVGGLATITGSFSFLLGVPTKIGEAIANFKESAESTGAKIISQALDAFVGPAMRGIGSFIDQYIKPSIDGASAWFYTLSINYDELSKFGESKDLSSEKIEISQKKIKPNNAEVKKSDEKNIKNLPKVTSKVKESLTHIRGFEDFRMV